MNIRIIILLSSLSISALNAADPSKVITFKTGHIKGTNHIEGANVERDAPTITHTIQLNQKETNTGETFQKLFDKAQEEGVPWLVASVLICTQTADLKMDYFDMVELFREDKRYDDKSFNNSQSCIQTCKKAIRKVIKKKYAGYLMCAHTINSFYSLENQSTLCFPPIVLTTPEPHATEISDIFCTLNIRLRNDYSQLKLLLSGLKCLAKNSDYTEFVVAHEYWSRLDDKLSKEKKSNNENSTVL